MDGYFEDPQYIPHRDSFLVRIPSTMYDMINNGSARIKVLSDEKYQIIDSDGKPIATIITNEGRKSDPSAGIPLDTIVREQDAAFVPVLCDFKESSLRSHIPPRASAHSTPNAPVSASKQVLTPDQMKAGMLMRFDSHKDYAQLQAIRRRFDESNRRVTNVLRRIRYRMENNVDIDPNVLTDAVNAIQDNESNMRKCIEDLEYKCDSRDNIY